MRYLGLCFNLQNTTINDEEKHKLQKLVSSLNLKTTTTTDNNNNNRLFPQQSRPSFTQIQKKPVHSMCNLTDLQICQQYARENGSRIQT